MQPDPYTPPTAPIHADERRKGPVVSVLAGLLVDFGGTVVVSFALAMGYGFVLAFSGRSPEEMQAMFADPSPTSWFALTATAIGCGFSVLGGYVCERMSRRNDYRLGVVLGAIGAAIGLAFSLPQGSLVHALVLAAIGFACVLLGTRLGFTKDRATR